MKAISLLGSLSFLFFISSCTTQKNVTSNYFENARDTSGKEVVNLQPPIVQKGDVLSIKVFSKANGIAVGDRLGADAPYNLQEQGTGGGNSTSGFMVDQNGNIEYPQLGTLHVEGLT